MSQLLPILKNHKEKAKQEGRNMHTEELAEHINSPFIMYGKDEGQFMSYEQSKSEAQDQKTKEEALRNLSKLNVEIQVHDMNGIKFAAIEHEYAAEKILDKAFLKHLGIKVGSNSIVVGIPFKGFMCAVAKGKGEAKLFGFVSDKYNAAPTYPISNSIYYIIDGNIEMTGGNQGKTEASEKYQVVGVNDQNGKVNFKVDVGNESTDKLLNDIQSSFQQIVTHNMKDSNNFGGKINYYIDAEKHELNNELRTTFSKVAENLTNSPIFKIIGTINTEKTQVSFYHGKTTLLSKTRYEEIENFKNETKETSIKKNDKKRWWKFW